MRIVVAGGGISGLATAYALQERAAARGVDLHLVLLEATDRLGGTIRTHVEQGFRCEAGPNGFLDDKPELLGLARRLGLADELLPASQAAKRRFVVFDGRLVEVPGSQMAFLKTPLLSIGAKLRVIGEPFARRRPEGVDETVAAFARRRLGRQVAERLIDPVVSGVFAGDPERLSLRAAFPRLAELEARFGSLATGARKLKRLRRKGADVAGPAGHLTSFKGGMQALVDALGRRVEHHLDAPLEALRRTGDGWTVEAGRVGRLAGVDRVVLAVPAHAAAGVLGRLDPALAEPLQAIPYAAATVVGLGFRREDVTHALDGFGFLVPGREKRPILGTLFTSSVFPGFRAPEDHVLLRTIVGGARMREVALLSDADVVPLVLAELATLLGVRADPVYVRVSRWADAIPQYETGHLDRVAALESAAGAFPGLHVTGNALRGVGLNDCAREAESVARAVFPD